MTRVKIKNFQSIGKTDFEINGFTVIVGKNNIGKSAIVRAITAALTNQTGSDFIRYGQKSTEVAIEREELKIEWRKGGTSTYKVNGESFSKLNRAVPQPILDAGFRKLEIGDQKINPLFAPQFDELFLLDEPGSVVTEVLSSMYNLDVISRADDLCQKELRATKTLFTTRTDDLKNLEEELEKFGEFEDIKTQVKDLKIIQTKCESLEKEIEEIQDFERKISHLAKTLNALKPVLKTPLPNVSEIKETEGYAKDVNELRDFETQLGHSLKTVESFSGFQDVSGTLDSIVPIFTTVEQQIVRDYHQIVEWDTLLSRLVKSVKMYKDSLQGMDDNWMKPDIDNIEKSVNDLVVLASIETEFKNLITTAKESRGELANVTSQLEQLRTEEKTEKERLKVCPLCDKPYD